jgi:hypothetical protein
MKMSKFPRSNKRSTGGEKTTSERNAKVLNFSSFKEFTATPIKTEKIRIKVSPMMSVWALPTPIAEITRIKALP